MAGKSGYVSISNNVAGLSLRARWVETTDESNNRSAVNVRMQGRKTDAYTTMGNYTGDVYINGSWISISGSHETMPGGGSWQDLGGSATRYVAHNADGSKTTTVGARGRIAGTSFGSTQSGTGSATLTDYDRRPSAPRSLTATVLGPRSVKLAWSAPSNTGGGITGYEYRIRTPGNASGTQIANDEISGRSLTYDDLQPGTDYGYIVRAKTADGWGPWSGYKQWRTISGAHVSDGSAWSDGEVFVSDGSAWSDGEVFVSDGSAWIPGE